MAGGREDRLTARDAGLLILFGTAFGFTLSRSGAADYDFIQGMFLFTNFQLYGILMTGVIVTGVGVLALRRIGRTVDDDPISIRSKPAHRGNIVGGALFGIGWAITGMCPGPIIVNLGEGKLYAVAAFAGVMTGTWLLGRFYDPISRSLGMPPIGGAGADAPGKGTA